MGWGEIPELGAGDLGWGWGFPVGNPGHTKREDSSFYPRYPPAIDHD
jgi:hypothetical protein